MCNLGSIALPSFIRGKEYDFQKLHDVTKVVAFNLNRIIDVNYYPVPQAQRSNMRNRPVGIGVQGLADLFMALRMPFDSLQARELNKKIFETIYHAALDASSDIAAVDGPYETWKGSPAEQGKLQFDLWGVTPSDLWDWTSLKAKIARTGLRNSLLIAPMPTASTSQILGNNECFEPYTSNIYTRRVLSGEFQVVCPWLLRDLVELGLWDYHTTTPITIHHPALRLSSPSGICHGRLFMLPIPHAAATQPLSGAAASLPTTSCVPVNPLGTSSSRHPSILLVLVKPTLL